MIPRVTAFAALSGPLPKAGVIAVALLVAVVLLGHTPKARAWAMLGALVLAPVLLLADVDMHLCRFVLYLCLVNSAFGFDQVTWNVGAADVERLRGSDMQCDVLHELPEVFISGYKIGLAIHLDEHTNLTLQMNV